MTIESQKLTLVRKILSIDNKAVIELIDKAIRQIEGSDSDSLGDISFYIGNIEPKVNVDKLKKEQAVQPLEIQELDELIEQADFTENIDELLESLK